MFFFFFCDAAQLFYSICVRHCLHDYVRVVALQVVKDDRNFQRFYCAPELSRNVAVVFHRVPELFLVTQWRSTEQTVFLHFFDSDVCCVLFLQVFWSQFVEGLDFFFLQHSAVLIFFDYRLCRWIPSGISCGFAPNTCPFCRSALGPSPGSFPSRGLLCRSNTFLRF